MSEVLKDMFADAESADARGDRNEALKEAFSKAEREASGNRWSGSGKMVKVAKEAQIANERLEMFAERVSKSLGADQAANVMAALDEMTKDVVSGDFTNAHFGGEGGTPGNLRPIDLQAPAKILVPRFTPLRNEIPRTKGIGGAAEYRRILGYSNANIGGVPDVTPFFDSEATTNSFGSLSLRRGAKISYAMDSHAVPYVEMSLSDLVSHKAQFASLGYEDLRALSHMALLYSHMIAEEKAILFGRGSAGGYAGNYSTSAPTAATAGTFNSTGGSVLSGTWSIAFTARAGVGETVAGTPTTTPVVITAGNAGQIVVTVPTAAAGSYGTNVYASSTATNVGTWFLGFIPAGEIATSITFNSLGAQISGTAAQWGALGTNANTTANLGYDGLLTVLTTPGVSGDVNSTAYTIATAGDSFIQDTCSVLYQNVYADPDEVWLNAIQSKNLGTFFRSAAASSANAAFRVNFEQTGTATVGTIVTGVYNESSPTRKCLDLRVHPYMPYGNAIVRSRTLDIPDSGIGDTSEVRSVQEYMAVDWPQVQFTYDTSTYWMGTLVHYAPAWSGACTALT